MHITIEELRTYCFDYKKSKQERIQTKVTKGKHKNKTRSVRQKGSSPDRLRLSLDQTRQVIAWLLPPIKKKNHFHTYKSL
jgi:hypothetical protein